MAALKTEFHEEQKFTQWWVWLILITTVIATGLAFYETCLKTGFSIELLFPFLLVPITLLLFVLFNLKTRIDYRGIHLHYFPVLKKNFKWSDIASIKIVRYTLWQVGGWGIRLGTPFGTVYNVKGKYGFWIRLKTGKEYLIGTQKPEKIKSLIKKYFNN